MIKKSGRPREPKPKRIDYDGPAEARMYRYHKLLLEAKTEAQMRIWFDELVLYRKAYDLTFN